ESGYVLETSQEEIAVDTLINAAGLGSDKVAAMLGIDIDSCGYRLQYCKGEYYSLSARYKFDHLVYPVPSPHFLGIHLTQDLSGRQRLGPNAYYVNNIDYDMDEAYRHEFFTAASRYIPDLHIDDIQPDYSGIRPKLQGPGQPFRDVVIKDERDLGFPGFINLIGIESPGLTSCLAIGRYVCEMLSEQI
ncbi:MAG: NAD(P)/FAD-dependent oxidoreductase, partial [Ignavibacteriales bacterium]